MSGGKDRTLCLVAFDLGAENGRAVLGRFDGRRLELEEVYRFANEPVAASGRLYWDVLRLFLEIERGLVAARRAAGGPLQSLAIDTWGVSFALFDQKGELAGHPYHYRDRYVEGIMEKAFAVVPARTLFEWTGIQLMPINTLYLLLSMKLEQSAQLASARHLLMMPAALSYLLSGEMVDEFTIASTSQMVDPHTRTWSGKVLDAFGFPRDLFGSVLQPGTLVGRLTPEIAQELGVEPVPVALTAGHDTASAVVAVPAAPSEGTGRTWAFISSGTWSLVGLELSRPVISDAAFQGNLSNEGGAFGTFRFLKNVMGLWLLQECRRRWAREGADVSYDQLVREAAAAPPRRCFIDPDDPGFLRPGDLVSGIREFCARTGQPAPESRGEVARTILESLALKYRWVVEQLERAAGVAIDRIHVVGGGSRNELLCQLTADVTGRPVVAGPAEATAAGNLLVQAVALRELSGLEELRSVVRTSFRTRLYEPAAGGGWEDAYRRFLSAVMGEPVREKPGSL
ncbi:rhamnulokinase family protein [Carboxydochorda subterranea]|uniref:Rhamnulokinase family protein n=1 Tax=Carboxydichorda subterranea TaxID=3109565 RepID=A0ABZ1BVG9_9FIRM|nr:rhamnulokinase family protein [Limnochorda sp. L945t]WRP16797.1 rhamnulokinase family protein [Limnochorda sp. L945t]